MGILRNGLPAALAVATLVGASVPGPAAAAGTGGTAAPGSSELGGGSTVGATPQQTSDPAPRRRSGRRPVLTSFEVGVSRFFDLGSPARVAFRIDGRAKTVHVKLEISSAGVRVRLLDLGDVPTGTVQTVRLTGREQGRLPEGALQLRLTARDRNGRGLSPASRASATSALAFYWHRFPLVGAFDYGGEGARFGAERDGHVHQGQDLIAAEGTPVVAPRAGTVQKVAYQAGAAGNYVVLRAADEDRTYVFMHLRDGSTRVTEGQSIATGARIADVGATGAASGAHLHFEIWSGAWFDGGHPIDPLPDLKSWDAWS